MKKVTLGLSLMPMIVQWSFAQDSPADQEIIKLSKDRWKWMADKNANVPDSLFHEKSMFVHMGGSFTKLLNSCRPITLTNSLST